MQPGGNPAHSRPSTPSRQPMSFAAFITMNWRGRPLVSYRTIVELIAATATKKGLRIRAERDTQTYPTGVKTTDAELAAVPLAPHDWHGEWNYTISSTAQSIER